MNDISDVCSSLEATSNEAREVFGGLSKEQLNWKPAEKSWSIAQCLDHLITVHGKYFPLLERLENGSVETTFLERFSPLSGFFGRFLIKSMRPENPKKMKTTASAEPSTSEIDAGILDRYCEHQSDLIDRLNKLPADLDAAKTIITSPLAGFVTYSLDDTFTILDVHGQRHIQQAKRVMEADGFPK